MNVVIVSDSHGNDSLLTLFRDRLRTYNPNLVIHLGDYYSDADSIVEMGYPVIRVPGTWKSQYQNIMIDNRRFETIKGWTLFLTHTPERHYNDLPGDIDPSMVIEDGICDLFFHGHTHHPKIEQDEKVWIINPGHIKSEFDRGFPPTFAVCQISESVCQIRIEQLLDQSILMEKEILKIV